MKNMQDLMEHTIQDLYSAENQILEALPQLISKAQSSQLRQAFEQHQRQTEKHVQRLEQVAKQLDIDPDGETCMAMQGLIEEAQDLLDQLDGDEITDAALIGAAQKVEHYEIASYGTARTLAQQAGQDKIADLLQQTLEEEKQTDEKLTEIATTKANQKAVKA
ncbi:YciE/YciF ferroxidase family protein [Spirosoma aerolatum]|uniref:YciE/YciF ferroxidase family protein n=1 Tax=Spirosoma aerolatum TaxID=1211326 RepID=UPI0009AC4CE3|nr:ferritin-like domain-containing protein [Spirosoma aerolatum]